MENSFHQLSSWAMFFLTVIIVLVSMETGFRYGGYRFKRDPHEKDVSIGTLVSAMLALLAFIMAFTFAMASSYYETRRMVLLKESNAIGTAYLRTVFIPEPERTHVRRLLREYTDVRINAVIQKDIQGGIIRSGKLLDELWGQVTVISGKYQATPHTSLFVSALNEVIDVNSERILSGSYKYIPWVIWLTLYFVMFIAMLAVGYQFGIEGMRNRFAAIVLAMTFSAVMVLIADLDNPGEGMIKVSQWSMLELQQKMRL